MDSQLREYPARGLPSFEYRGHNQIGAAHHIAAGKHLRMSCLEGPLTRGRHPHTTTGVQRDAMLLKPTGRARLKAECNYHRIGRDDLLGVRDVLGQTPAAWPHLPEPGLHHLDALDAVATDDLHRLTIEQELDAFFLAVLVVAA